VNLTFELILKTRYYINRFRKVSVSVGYKSFLWSLNIYSDGFKISIISFSYLNHIFDWSLKHVITLLNLEKYLNLWVINHSCDRLRYILLNSKLVSYPFSYLKPPNKVLCTPLVATTVGGAVTGSFPLFFSGLLFILFARAWGRDGQLQRYPLTGRERGNQGFQSTIVYFFGHEPHLPLPHAAAQISLPSSFFALLPSRFSVDSASYNIK